MKIDIEDVRRLNVQPGDTIMFRFEHGDYITTDEFHRWREDIAAVLPEGVKALLIDKSVEVNVITGTTADDGCSCDPNKAFGGSR